MKYNSYQLKKLESLFSTLGYKVRFEKGSFQSGYCMVENTNVVVINRFFDTKARIEVLIEILHTIEVDAGKLNGAELSLYQDIEGLFSKMQTNSSK